VLAERLDQSDYLVPLIMGECGAHIVRAEYRLALSLGEKLEQIGEVRNNPTAQLLGRYVQGASRCCLGEFVASRSVLERCMGLADPACRIVGRLSIDPFAGMLAWLAMTLAYLGYIDQARLRMDEALSEARQLGQAYTLAIVLSFANGLARLIGSPMLHIEEFVVLSTEGAFSSLLGEALAYRGRSLIAPGHGQERLTSLTQLLTELRNSAALIGMPRHFMLAEVHAMLGQPIEQQNCLAEAARIVETTDGPDAGEAELLPRVPSDLLNTTGERSAAERHYRKAITIAERQSAKLFQLRAATSLARLWRDQGKRAKARDLLGPIYNWFTEGLDASDLKDAKALLDELA
jgi:tetratricopeptide (TPR) repeat protein